MIRLAVSLICLVAALALLGSCGTYSQPAEEEAPAPPSPPAAAAAAEIGADFDPKATGHVTGQVVWQGSAPPGVRPFRSTPTPLGDQPFPPARDWANPNAPRLGPGGGLSSAVVFLRGVEPRRSRPWRLPALRVELRGQRFHVRQGESSPEGGNVGFVRLGEGVDFASRDDLVHSVQGRGACFFSRTLPDLESTTRSPPLDAPGVVELSSGAGYFWMRAYLFVTSHPYCTTTDAEGRFRLEQVPAGEYDLVVWHPSWRTRDEERHPETFRVCKITFQPPLQTTRRVRVEPGKTITLRLTFPPPTP